MRLLLIFMGGTLLGGTLGDTLTFGAYPDTEAWPAPTSPGAVGFLGIKLALVALGLWMIYRGLRPKGQTR